MLIAVKNIDEVVEIIKTSKDPHEARSRLIKRFDLSEIQAQAILDMRLQRLTGLEITKLEEEYRKVQEEIAYLKSILASEEKVFELIREELEELKVKYGDKRRTSIEDVEDEIDIEDLIQEETMAVTVSHAGYIKRMPLDAYRVQKRGGVGLKGTTTKEGDFIDAGEIGGWVACAEVIEEGGDIEEVVESVAVVIAGGSDTDFEAQRGGIAKELSDGVLFGVPEWVGDIALAPALAAVGRMQGGDREADLAERQTIGQVRADHRIAQIDLKGQRRVLGDGLARDQLVIEADGHGSGVELFFEVVGDVNGCGIIWEVGRESMAGLLRRCDDWRATKGGELAEAALIEPVAIADRPEVHRTPRVWVEGFVEEGVGVVGVVGGVVAELVAVGVGDGDGRAEHAVLVGVEPGRDFVEGAKAEQELRVVIVEAFELDSAEGGRGQARARRAVERVVPAIERWLAVIELR